MVLLGSHCEVGVPSKLRAQKNLVFRIPRWLSKSLGREGEELLLVKTSHPSPSQHNPLKSLENLFWKTVMGVEGEVDTIKETEGTLRKPHNRCSMHTERLLDSKSRFPGRTW